jgi:hypothetical protein
MTANNDKRIILGGKEFFYYSADEREDRKNIYKAGKTKFSFHMTRMKQIIECRQRIWDGLELPRKCVCERARVCRGYRRIILLFARCSFCARRYNVCDDTFIQNENSMGVAKWESSGKTIFPQWKSRKLNERLLCFLLAV